MDVRRSAVGNSNIRTRTAVREPHRREGHREHRTHLSGQQETCKLFQLFSLNNFRKDICKILNFNDHRIENLERHLIKLLSALGH